MLSDPGGALHGRSPSGGAISADRARARPISDSSLPAPQFIGGEGISPARGRAIVGIGRAQGADLHERCRGEHAGAVFRGRRPTGEVWSREFAAAHPGCDWILSRILWLCGEEPGRNRGGEVDTMRRYIYLHGTGDDQPMGVARSHGCVRMRNRDIIELFELVPAGTVVEIVE